MLSVIISAYDNHNITAIHVRECMNNTLIPDEIIVVNDGGNSNLKDMLKELDLKTKIIYARIHQNIAWNYTGARNLGFWLSRGDIVCIEDTDNIPSNHVYEKGIEYLKNNKDVHLIRFGERPIVYKKQVVSLPIEKWVGEGKRPTHDDTLMMRRSVYLTLKGCDERYAGRYAWACTNFKRKLRKANFLLKSSKGSDYIPKVKEPYFAVADAETTTCSNTGNCEQTTKERQATDFCTKCSLPIRTKSYRNYELAGELEHIQSPKGILNFTYTIEEL